MCNIAGYVGERDAAPILLDMMSRETGYAGGYYTGIVTLADGRLHWDKVLGDLDLLQKALKGKKLPGHVGIIHSRSNSGGDREWAHPFVSNDETLAYVANGANGQFAEKYARRRDEIADSLEKRGIVYSSRSNPVGSYPRLSDGTGVHMSEVMCHLIRCYIQEGEDPETAMRHAFKDYPSEIVALAIDTAAPDAILAARYNLPMMLGRASDGVYLATTVLAFPKDVHFDAIDVLPAGCSATVWKDGWTVHGFQSSIPVAPLDASLFRKAENRLLRFIRAAQEPVGLAQCCETIKSLWPAGMLTQNYVLCYEALRGLLAEGKIREVHVAVPGAPEGKGKIMSTSFRFAKV